eukprot:TRINITY_DN2545_c0_g1_i1.p1 TRINITY_DN2545_c0_g1~~TRINITY_DN2545_c0_g1_i1.p1  ORF type:complete len:346 (-),score=116.02 TRINITY_DN2545_c0_g1_i1:291-1328(-)
MGCAGTKVDKGNIELERRLKEDKKKFENSLKILLLGAGESGKSTIAKQFKIVNTGDFTPDELKEFRTFLQENTKDSMKSLVNASENLRIALDASVAGAANKAKETTPETPFSPELAQAFQQLWKDKGIQEVYRRANEFQLNDNAKYCLENLDRIAKVDYQPTQQDALHCRVRTTGVIETKFNMGKREVTLVDVGGQRAERRKWMNCFDSVTAVIFCLALSEYDLKLVEDNVTNRMHESLKIFEEVSNKWFPQTTIIIFLNKSDLFADKITRVPLTVCFNEFPGPNEFEPASNYIREKLLSMNKNDETRLYAHITCATDTQAFGLVFDAIKETLINASLKRLGLLG